MIVSSCIKVIIACLLLKDAVLKVAILDFLSAIVETQPGLVEVFFDVNETSLAETKVRLLLFLFPSFILCFVHGRINLLYELIIQKLNILGVSIWPKQLPDASFSKLEQQGMIWVKRVWEFYKSLELSTFLMIYEFSCLL